MAVATDTLERIVHSWKSYTARHFQHRTGRAWQPEHWDRIIRTEREFEEMRQKRDQVKSLFHIESWATSVARRA